ncbi:hypothetical protein OS493_005319, partial [Desmophyllum pertusum]
MSLHREFARTVGRNYVMAILWQRETGRCRRQKSEKETELLSAFAESYLNAANIGSNTDDKYCLCMADKLSLKALRGIYLQ